MVSACTLNVLIKYKLYEIRNYLLKEPVQVLLWLPRLMFDAAGFCLLFRWLSGNPEYGAILLFNSLLLIFIVACFTGFSGLFTGKQNPFLLTAPVTFPSFLIGRYLDRLVNYLEIAVILGVPAAAVLGSKFGLFPAVSLLLTGTLAVSVLSYLLVIIVSCLFGGKSRVIMLLIAAGALFFQIAAFLRLRSTGMPGTALVLANAVFLAILLLALLLLIRGRALGRCYYLALARIHAGRRNGYRARFLGRSGYVLLSAFKGRAWALIAKDILFLTRNPVHWARVLLLLIAVFLYSLNRGRLLPPDFLKTPALDIAVMLGLAHFLINEVTVNAFAAEANRIKILMAAPVSPLQLGFAKYASFGLPVLAVSVLCMIITGILNGMNLPGLAVPVLLVGVSAFGITAVLVGLGAVGSLPEKETGGFMDQFMVEQVAISSPRALFVFTLGTLLLIIDVAVAYRIYSFTGDFLLRLGPVLIVCLINLLSGLASILFGAGWVKRNLERRS